MSPKSFTAHSFNDQETLIRVHNGDIPSTWRVFRTSRKTLSVLLFGFCAIIGLLVGFLIIYFWVNFDHHPPVPPHSLYAIITIMLIYIIGTIFLSIFIWLRMKNVVLVLMPEGFVRGDSERPKRVLHIHYQEVAEMHINGSSVIIQQNKYAIKKLIDCRLFDCPTQEVASSIVNSYRYYNIKTHPATRKE